MAAPREAPGRFRTRDVLVPGGPSDFGSLLLSPPVLAGLEAAGFHRPSPVQLKAIPLGRCGLGERAGRARGRARPGAALTAVGALCRSHRAGQVRHRENLRVRHHRPGCRAAGELRHAGEALGERIALCWGCGVESRETPRFKSPRRWAWLPAPSCGFEPPFNPCPRRS